MPKQPGAIIAVLIDWAIPESNRGRKATGKSRLIVMLADQRNYTIAIEREGYVPVGQKFASNFHDLIMGLMGAFGVHPRDAVDRIAKGMAQYILTEKPFEYDESKSPLENAQRLDEHYQTDLISPANDILQIIGKGSDEPEEVEVPEEPEVTVAIPTVG